MASYISWRDRLAIGCASAPDAAACGSYPGGTNPSPKRSPSQPSPKKWSSLSTPRAVHAVAARITGGLHAACWNASLAGGQWHAVGIVATDSLSLRYRSSLAHALFWNGVSMLQVLAVSKGPPSLRRFA